MSKIETKKIIPRGKYILVKQDEPESRENEFGLSVPDSQEQDQKATGVVESVAKGITDLKVGDKVVFGAYAGEQLKVTEKHKEVTFLLLHDDDIIATIK